MFKTILNKKQLKEILNQVQDIGSNELVNQLDNYIKSNKQGNYLMNILNISNYNELVYLNKIDLVFLE